MFTAVVEWCRKCAILLLLTGVSNVVLAEDWAGRISKYLPGAVVSGSWLETNCGKQTEDVTTCQLTVQALDGSESAAIALANAALPLSDDESQFYWLRVAAENGSPEGMRRLGEALAGLQHRDYGTAHTIRAKFWLEKAADRGDAKAKAILANWIDLPRNSAEAVSAENHLPANEDQELFCGPAPWGKITDVRNSTNKGMNISCREIAMFEVNALAGSQELAVRLLNFFDGIQAVFLPHDKSWRNRLYWSTISAENGRPGSIYTLGLYMTDKGVLDRPDNPDFKLRGRFWLRKAANEGYASARSALEKLDKEDIAGAWLSFPRFCRHFLTSNWKLFERQRAQRS